MNESAGGGGRGEDVAVPLLLKTLEDILYNIITQKKVETQKPRTESQKISKEIYRKSMSDCGTYRFS
jgi:hypothetical protein